MATSLFWRRKERAAFISLLFFSVFNAQAQTSSSQNITYTCRATRLETVMDALSKESGYDFVYSSSIVDVAKPISLTVKNKSISDVLALIEPQANVSFRLYDRHILVRSNPRPATIVAQKRERRILTKPTFETNDSLLLTSTSKTIAVRTFESQATQMEDHLNRRIIELQQLLRANIPHNIPNSYLNGVNFNNRYNGWYASIGTYVGDRSSGLEFQGGLKYVYGVFTPRWSADHGFYGAYGIGSSLQLSGHFSLNAMYMFSGYTNSETIRTSRMGNYAGPDIHYYEIRRQHQVKLGLRYSFNENLSLRAGPVFNYRSTASNAPFHFSPPYFTERWIGWDMSLQFRINFYKKDD